MAQVLTINDLFSDSELDFSPKPLRDVDDMPFDIDDEAMDEIGGLRLPGRHDADAPAGADMGGHYRVRRAGNC